MSPGPSTRNKNKRRIHEDDTEITYAIYMKIYSSGEVSTNDVNQLYMISKPVCQACRQNTKNNPNCFCGLVPPPNGSRKSGLWQKISQILSGLGHDPSKDLCAQQMPTGLKNLGATCYVNSILQCLYMNKSFRDGIFASEISLLEQYPVLNQLVRLFAQLHSCNMTFVDPAPFIKILELDNGVQQDSHEFLTLLLSLLERCLSHSKVSKVRTVVQDLFRGNVTHVTRCSKCGTESAASSNMEDFYGLELNVKGLKSLDESLNEYLSLEELNGDNQYFCDSCMMRVDATHCVKLHSLPTILNFQLKRCVFLPKTTTKKKITSPFCFPRVLCMDKHMSEPSQLELLYDLSAILIHKGVAVNSGHYVAHIKDDNTGRWWELDDEHVSNLGLHPLGEGSSSVSSLKSVVGEVVPKHSDDDIGKLKMDTYAEEFSSSDAYMLMYSRRRSATSSDDIHPIIPDGPSMNDENLCSLPSHLCDEIKTLNDSYLESCKKYKSKREAEMKHVTDRREEVRSVLYDAPVSSLEEPYYWISTDWLRQWADEIHVSAVDNTKICCVHGKAPVNKVNMMKRLSKQSWIYLVKKYGGGPILSDGDHCTICLIAEATNLATAARCKDQVSSMRKLAEEALSRNIMDEKSYYVSKVWLQQWMRKKNSDCLCEADAEPTAAIRCPHGELMPDCGSAGKRLLIPEKLWLFFVKRANKLKPDDILGCSAFPSDLEPCAQCCGELIEAACLEDSLRTVKLRQRQIHENLALGKSIPLALHCRYYLLPSSWLLEWRNYVSSSGKNSALFMKPELLDGIINSLKCTKHSLLLERPVDVSCRRGIIIQKPTATDGLTIILENDWKLFCQDWGGTEENCLIADIEASNSPTGCSDNFPIIVDEMDPHDSCNDQSNLGEFVIRTDPEVCEECIGERESRDLIEKCSYNDEDIRVCFVEDKDPPKSILEASQSSDLDRRISKRSKKTRFGKSKNFKVSGSTTVYQLKMMIWESFGVVKEDQVLHKGSIIIEGDTTTLADANIFPGNILWVTDSEIHGYRDIAEELSEDRMVESREPEEGFRGTLLTLNV